MKPTAFTTDTGRLLSFDFDASERLSALSPNHTVKGMFTAQVVKQLRREELDALRKDLVSPPRGMPLPFSDYPVVDHQRLTIALVRRLFPGLPLSEALRRFERSSASRFADTTLGKVMVSMLRDPGAGLMKLPEISRMVSNVGDIVASRTYEGFVRLEYSSYSGFVDSAIVGSLEGVVLFFGKQPRIDVEIRSAHDASYIVRWA